MHRTPSRFRGWPAIVGWLIAWGALGRALPNRAEADDAQRQVELAGTVVDEAGKPVAGVTIVSLGANKARPVHSAADGTFEIKVAATRRGLMQVMLKASSDDGRLGLLSFFRDKPEPLKLVIKPARVALVRVVDRDGKPVEGAEVGFLAGLGGLSVLDGGRTDADGRWNARVPAETQAWGIYARKAHTGFDYALSGPDGASAKPTRPLPQQLTLTLDGARAPLRVNAVNRDGQPLAGVKIGVWLVGKPGHEGQANLSGVSRSWAETGNEGAVTLDWLPATFTGAIRIISDSTDYYAEQATWIRANDPVDAVTITHFPYERLSGQVTTADGRPAPGATVSLQGPEGGGSSGFHAVVLTDAEGRYTEKVYSEQAYIITTTRGDLAAPYKWGVVVRAGQPALGVDLTLGPAIRLRGRVTVGTDQKPVAKVRVQADINKGNIPAELRREGDRFAHLMRLPQYQETDAGGRFEFLLGPGEYALSGPARVKPVKLNIPAGSPPAELVRDLNMPRPATGPFAATVVDAEGQPIAGAVVGGVYTSMEARAWFNVLMTDAAGTFRLERSLDPLVLYVKSPETGRAAVARIDSEAAEARLVVKPTTSVSGRLVDPEGKPLTGRAFEYGIRIHLGPTRGSLFRWCFGGNATTDTEGRFQLSGLVVGETYEIHIAQPDGGRISTARTRIAPTNPGPLALGDVAIDLSPPRPYVPPTPAERAAEAFAARKEKSPREKLAYVLTEAKREYTCPLLLFGAPKDPACIELFTLFEARSSAADAAPGVPRFKTPADLRWDFELAALERSDPAVAALAEDLGVALESGQSPMLAVLSEEGKRTATYPLQLGTGKSLDVRSLSAFLLDHALPTRDAERMLADGLAQARAEDKRVFLIMSASWCGPCRMLARYLAANKGELQRHYIFVKLDVSRDTHAQDLKERFEGKGAANGIP